MINNVNFYYKPFLHTTPTLSSTYDNVSNSHITNKTPQPLSPSITNDIFHYIKHLQHHAHLHPDLPISTLQGNEIPLYVPFIFLPTGYP
jgi:hypothetical protein